MRRILMTVLMVSGTTALRGQDTAEAKPRTAYSVMYERFQTDDQGRAVMLTMRWSKWRPGNSAFEGSASMLAGGGAGGAGGEAGAAYVVNDAPVTVVFRGGVALLVLPAEQAFITPVGAYAGLAILVGTGQTNLRLELARHEYIERQDNIGGWVFGLGLAFTPRSRSPTGTDR